MFWGHLISGEYPSYEKRGGFLQPPLRVVGIILHYKMRQVDQSIFFLFIPKWDNLLKAFLLLLIGICISNARLKWMYLSNWSPKRIIEHWIHVDISNYTNKWFEMCQVSPFHIYKEQNEHLEFFQLEYDKSAPFDYFA